MLKSMRNVFQNTAGERCLLLLKVAQGIIIMTESLNIYKHKGLKNNSSLILFLTGCILRILKAIGTLLSGLLHVCQIL